MIVDVHTHVPTHRGPVPPDERVTDTTVGFESPINLTGSVTDYMEAMAPVDRAIVFGIAREPGRAEPPLMDWRQGWPAGYNQNDIASEVAASDPDKFIPFMSLHPGQPDVDDEYDRAKTDLGCRGMKLGATYQVFGPTGAEAFHLYARLEKDRLPVMFHQGTSPLPYAPLSYSHPSATDRIATEFPNLTMVLAHIGHPWHGDCLAVVRKHPNVWADVSGLMLRPWSAWTGLRLCHEWGVTGKLLLGSDWPITEPKGVIGHLRGLGEFSAAHGLPGIPEDEIEGIIARDSLDILGLGQTNGQRARERNE